MNEVQEHSDPGSLHVLILNKMDVQTKQLNPKEIEMFAQRNNLIVYETSAKTGKNVTGLFVEICRQLISKE